MTQIGEAPHGKWMLRSGSMVAMVYTAIQPPAQLWCKTRSNKGCGPRLGAIAENSTLLLVLTELENQPPGSSPSPRVAGTDRPAACFRSVSSLRVGLPAWLAFEPRVARGVGAPISW